MLILIQVAYDDGTYMHEDDKRSKGNVWLTDFFPGQPQTLSLSLEEP